MCGEGRRRLHCRLLVCSLVVAFHRTWTYADNERGPRRLSKVSSPPTGNAGAGGAAVFILSGLWPRFFLSCPRFLVRDLVWPRLGMCEMRRERVSRFPSQHTALSVQCREQTCAQGCGGSSSPLGLSSQPRFLSLPQCCGI